jgi:hypothetical protein
MPSASNAGIGSQFTLLTAAVITKVKVKIYKSNGETTPPTGHITARLYSSHTNTPLDRDDYAETNLAESTNSIDVSALDEGNNNAVEFTFNSFPLAIGIYFICLFSSEMVPNDGYVAILGTDSSVTSVGYITFWNEDEGRWGSFNEW